MSLALPGGYRIPESALGRLPGGSVNQGDVGPELPGFLQVRDSVERGSQGIAFAGQDHSAGLLQRLIVICDEYSLRFFHRPDAPSPGLGVHREVGMPAVSSCNTTAPEVPLSCPAVPDNTGIGMAPRQDSILSQERVVEVSPVSRSVTDTVTE